VSAALAARLRALPPEALNDPRVAKAIERHLQLAREHRQLAAIAEERRRAQAGQRKARKRLQEALDDFATFCDLAWSEVDPAVLEWDWYLDLLCRDLTDLADEAERRMDLADLIRNPPPDAAQALRDLSVPDETLDALLPALEDVDPEDSKTWVKPLTIAFAELGTLEMVICMPPRHLKSIICKVLFQAWWWLRRPGLRVMTITNDHRLGTKHARALYNLVASPLYQQLVALAEARGVPAWTLDAQQGSSKDRGGRARQKLSSRTDDFETSAGGSCQAVSVGGSILGKGAHGQIIDDPYDTKDALKGGEEAISRRMGEVVSDYDLSWSTRLDDARVAWRLTIMQRLDPEDLAGVLIRRGVWRTIILPMEYDPDFPEDLGGVHPDDPRTLRGELLTPGRSTRKVAEMKRTEEGRWLLDVQFNQRARRRETGTLTRALFQQRYSLPPREQAAMCERILLSNDAAASRTGASLYVILVCGFIGPRLHILDAMAGHWDYDEYEQAMLGMMAKWAMYQEVIVENKAHGAPFIQRQQHQRRAIRGFEPRRDTPGTDASKKTRAGYAIAMLKALQILLPLAEYAPWVEDFIAGMCAWPNVSDWMDTLSQVAVLEAVEHAADDEDDYTSFLYGA